MLRLGIISNPFSKANKNCPEHNTRMWYTLANEGQFEVTHSISELEKVCQEFCERKINLVGIVGGDGSTGLVLSNLLKAYGREHLPKILLLKGGTINFLAANLGIKAPALTCLNDALFLIKHKMPLYEIPVKTIEVNGRLGFIFAGGIAATFLEEFYKNKTNIFGASFMLSKFLMDGIFCGKINGGFKRIVKSQSLQIKTTSIPIWENNSLFQNADDYTLLFASTVPNLPLNINLFDKISLNSETAQFVSVTEKNGRLLRAAVRAIIGADIAKYSGVSSINFDRVEIRSQTPISYSLDGDLLYADDGKININLASTFIFCSPYYIANNA